jgi:DNA-directed RNA polymerase subunit RPC12/RpoP
MQIVFSYYYFLVCGKCGAKITEIAPTIGSNHQHSFNINGGYTCPSCGEAKEHNVVSSVAKTFKES